MSMRYRSLIAAYFILFLDNFGYAVIFPIFPTLLLDHGFGLLPGITTEAGRNIFLGILLSAYPLTQFFGAPFFGDVADRYGRRKALTWTILGTIIGYALTAIGVFTKLYWLLIISRLLTGFFSGNLAICMAIVADLNTESKERGKSMSLVATFLGLSWVSAIIVGAFFTNSHNLKLMDPSIPFWIIALLSFSSLLVLVKFYRDLSVPQQQHRLRLLKAVNDVLQVLHYKQLGLLYVMCVFWFLGFFMALQWVAPVAIERFQALETQIMWILALEGLLWAISSGLLNRWLIAHFSLWQIALWNLLITSVLYFIAAISGSFIYFGAAFALSGFFVAIAWGNSMSLISLAAPSTQQGVSLGIGQSMLSLAQILGPFLGGIVASFSVKPIFFMCSLFVLIGFLLLLVYIVRKNPSYTR